MKQSLAGAIVLIVFLGGCAAIQEKTRAKEVQLAQNDHAACLERGHDYPSERYRKCRLYLADQRLRETWMEVQLMKRYQQPTTPEFVRPNTPAPAEPYRPIRDDEFFCEPRFYEDSEYIHCYIR
ncbi:MAG: hypothetical protein MJA83_13420 [Gammaproteobacteria bacterium]|nr:hypothetical protein [Gammaproteobacteria bacterium]